MTKKISLARNPSSLRFCRRKK